MDVMRRFHPVVSLIYFGWMLIITMSSLHPATLLISFLISIWYGCELLGVKILKNTIIMGLPFVLIVSLLNVFFNHKGETILFYLNANPITKESIVYGFILGLMCLDMVVWFVSFNKVFTADKIIILLSKVHANLALLFSMSLRFTSLYRRKYSEIVEAQELIGSNKTWKRPMEGIQITVKRISILITWALENALETSISMKIRGFGLKGRSSFIPMKMKRSDKIMVGVLFILIILFIITWPDKVNYVPWIEVSWSIKEIVNSLVLIVVGVLPIAIGRWEKRVWKFI